jgi:hypothetical protein
MRKKFIVIALILILLWVFASCTRPEKKTEIYSFSGENENIAINNGLIIVTDDLEKFIGGDLSFKGKCPERLFLPHSLSLHIPLGKDPLNQ